MDKKPIAIDQEMAINANGFLSFCQEEGFEIVMLCRNPRTGFQKSIVYASAENILSMFGEYIQLPEGQNFISGMEAYLKGLGGESDFTDFKEAIAETVEKFSQKQQHSNAGQ